MTEHICSRFLNKDINGWTHIDCKLEENSSHIKYLFYFNNALFQLLFTCTFLQLWTVSLCFQSILHLLLFKINIQKCITAYHRYVSLKGHIKNSIVGAHSFFLHFWKLIMLLTWVQITIMKIFLHYWKLI